MNRRLSDTDIIDGSSQYYKFWDEQVEEKQPLVKEKDELIIASAFNTFVLFNYIVSDISKKPRSYRIGVFTVTITVAFVILIYNILDIAPAIFLKLSEDQVGESDFVFRAKASFNISESADEFMYSGLATRESAPVISSFFVNTTKMQESVQNSTYYEGLTPRWIFLADLANATNPDLKTPGIVFVIDSRNEINIGLGRDFSKTILGYREAFITHSTLRYLGIQAGTGEKVQIVIDIGQYFDTSTYASMMNSPYFEQLKEYKVSFMQQISRLLDQLYAQYSLQEIKESFVLRLDFVVVEDYDQPKGKFPNSYGNVLVIDYKHILPDVLQSLHHNLASKLSESTSKTLQKLVKMSVDIPIQEYALQVDGVLKDREQYYINSKKVSSST